MGVGVGVGVGVAVGRGVGVGTAVGAEVAAESAVDSVAPGTVGGFMVSDTAWAAHPVNNREQRRIGRIRAAFGISFIRHLAVKEKRIKLHKVYYKHCRFSIFSY